MFADDCGNSGGVALEETAGGVGGGDGKADAGCANPSYPSRHRDQSQTLGTSVAASADDHTSASLSKHAEPKRMGELTAQEQVDAKVTMESMQTVRLILDRFGYY